MSVLSAPSVPRRRLAAAVVAVVVSSGAAAGLLSTAGPAEARPTLTAVPGTSATPSILGSVPVTVPVSLPVSVPVTVPADVTFDLDVVPVTVTPDPAAETGPRASRAGARPPVSGDVRQVAAATLAQLPASAGVTLLFDRPELAGHLGGVFMGSPGYLLVNASRLAGDPAKTADVVRHEIAHIYQARLATTLGFDAVDARMTELFGERGLERAADCVALALGATWTHYTKDCSGRGQAAAVQALLEGRMP